MSTISHEEMARTYRQMARVLRHDGWNQDTLYGTDGKSTCLVGVADKVTEHRSVREVIERDMVEGLGYRGWLMIHVLSMFENPVVKQRMRQHPYVKGIDGGMIRIEAWNDRPFRRRATVIAFLNKQARRHERAARRDLRKQIASLRYRITQLEKKVASLEAENEKLRGEVSWLKARKRNWSAKELRESSAELARLDDELNAILQSA